MVSCASPPRNAPEASMLCKLPEKDTHSSTVSSVVQKRPLCTDNCMHVINKLTSLATKLLSKILDTSGYLVMNRIAPFITLSTCLVAVGWKDNLGRGLSDAIDQSHLEAKWGQSHLEANTGMGDPREYQGMPS